MAQFLGSGAEVIRARDDYLWMRATRGGSRDGWAVVKVRMD